MKPTEIKIASIGGGGRYWVRELFGQLAQSSCLAGTVDLYDLDHEAARKNVNVAAAIFARPEARTQFKVRAVRRLGDALRGADFVVLSIEPGPTQMRYADLVIPARHGILQPVGDTTGPGGIARTLRAVPIYTGFARQIAAHCPRAWVINYTNPMTLCTATLYAAAPEIKAFGCCHEVSGTQSRLAGLVAEWFDVPRPPRQEIALELAGVNHFTWITSAVWRGHNLMARLRAHIATAGFFRSRARRAAANRIAERWFACDGVVAFDLLRRFGALGAAGDRHLVEFVPWYARSEAELHRWGVVLTPYAWRRRRVLSADYSADFYAAHPLAPSDEEGVRLIEAVVGFAPLTTNVNLPNRGQMPGLPADHVVETNAFFDRGRVTPAAAAALPAGAHALVRRIADVQQLTLRAALERDADLTLQALLADPLVQISTDAAWRMLKDMLRYMRSALPGWRAP